jgi:uncharacterized membrane protein
MWRYLLIIIFFVPLALNAQELPKNTDEYVRAEVVEVLEEGNKAEEFGNQPYQKVRAEIEEGDYVSKTVELEQGYDFSITEHSLVDVGDKVVLIGLDQGEGREFFIIDHYRLPAVALGFLLFFALVVWVGGKKGVGSIIGLVISLAIIAGFIMPRIIAGDSPLFISLVGASFIAIISITVAHGFERRTAVALVGTVLTLAIAVGLAWFYVLLTKLSGMGSENAYYLQVGELANLDLRGLLLGGIIIGALGVLDDVTTSQTAAVEEIYKADPSVSPKELYKRSMSVGREHIASLVNTLALAYVGAAFPLFLLIASNDSQPLWVMFNGQLVIEEVVRTLVGSFALVLAVPITTVIAIWRFHKP